MNIRLRRLLLSAFLLTPVLMVAVYLVADYWLESAGGRRAIERALASRSGLSVQLKGEFDLMLLPSIGASGTDLVVRGNNAEAEWLRSQEYEISVALKPLIERRVLIDSVRLSGGVVYTEHFSEADESPRNGAESSLAVPEVQKLVLQDFRIALPGREGNGLLIREFTMQDFAAGTRTPFRLDLAELGLIQGQFLWDPERLLPDLDIEWKHEDRGMLELLLESALGKLQARYQTSLLETPLSMQLRFEYFTEGLRFEELRLESSGQHVGGDGCLLLGDPPKLQLNLVAESIDLDAFSDVLEQNEDGSASFPLDLNVIFKSARLQSGGAVVHGATLRLGSEPDCSAFTNPVPGAD